MLSNQSFTLEVEGVAFTADATKSSGVAAALDVSVDGQIWKQVSTLKDSAPGDRHYAIRMTEEGYVKILFGDGQYGRRLPSGNNNIRVRYRVGSGLSGIVPAGSLEKPVDPHPLIEAVLQPIPATGGGDMEDAASLRKNAPSTLLALERAVSLSDFSHLAAAQSSVWQARAYSQILHAGRTESVVVVIVPAGGVQSLEIRKAIRSFLQSHALPGVRVTVDPFVEERFSLSITVRIRTDEFVAEEVEKVVASALSDHFTLQNRKLGEHLYLSEVYKIVEGIQGVENSICVLNGVENLQIIEAENESTVVYLDTGADENPSTLTVTHQEYQP
jgi:predicted phage baseplate assembly protein